MSFCIPFDICREILLRLPAEFLLRFRAVCKRWRDMIDDPCFVKAHTENQRSTNSIIIRNSVGSPFHPLYYFKLDDLNFTSAPQTIPVIPVALSRSGLSRLNSLPLTACNGLMLFAPGYRKVDRINRELTGTWEIWNPLTGERIKLPDPSIDLDLMGVGLGYDCVADDYRVVVIESTGQTHLYSLKLDSWRKVGVCPFDLWSRRRIKHGAFLKGASHWVSLHDKVIIAFDFATENYRRLKLPKLKKRLKGPVQIQALGGCLFLSYIDVEKVNYFGEENYKYHFDVWVMNDYEVEDSWIKLLSLKEDPNFYINFRRYTTKLVAYMKNERRLLMQHQNCFIWFDVGNSSIKTVDIHGFSGLSEMSAQTCAGTLLRLHDTCGRVASKIRTRGTVVKAYDKLTFCVRDYEKGARVNARTTHDDCYNLDSNCYAYSCQGGGIHMPSSYPDGDYSVPLDICHEIFLHLPAKSLIRFRAVCKAFRAIIDEPCFVRAHTNNQLSANTILIRNSSGPPFNPFYSFDLDALYCTDGLQKIPTTPLNFTHCRLSRLTASVCNGLVLVSNKNLELWNPLTNEHLKLPRYGFFNSVMTTGLGYDYATDDYKVVVVDRWPRLEGGEYEYKTHVYSLRSDTWRMIGNFPHGNYHNHHDLILPGVYLCGVLHWTSWSMHKIITLDLGTENYSQLQWPPIRERSLTAYDHKVVEVLGGCLVLNDYDDDNVGMDVWVMKDYGAEDSWTKFYRINDRYTYHSPIGSCRPIAFTKNKTQIFVQADGEFFLLDVGGGGSTSKRISIHGLGKSSYANAFSGSIFRIHDNCGVSGSGSGSTSLRAPRPRRAMKRKRDISDTELHFCVRPAPLWHGSYRPHSTWCGWSSEDED